MAKKEVVEMATKQGWPSWEVMAISMGSDGPLCHVIVPAGKNSLLLAVSRSLPPRMNTPTLSIVTAAMSDLAVVIFPILSSSQRWLIRSSTKQEARGSVLDLPSSIPPQVATRGEGFEVKKGGGVKKVAWNHLPAGKEGREHSVSLVAG